MQPLDLVFVHEGRKAPLIGEFIKAKDGEMRLHVIWGPRDKIGKTVVAYTDHLQDYTVPAYQMQSLFGKTGVPEELKQKGSMYLVTDRPTMYPNFSQAPETQQAPEPEMPAAPQAAPAPSAQPQAQDPNLALANDIMKGGEEKERTPFDLSKFVKKPFVGGGTLGN